MVYGVAKEFGHARVALACAPVAPTDVIAQTTAAAHTPLNHPRHCG